jgi:DNA-directed RNA polymerase subunit RPC12/RpoP
MSIANASNENSHPVDVECPSCSHRFQVPLKACSAGAALACLNCNSNILIATPVLRQLLQEIDNDLRAPDDLPIVLRPAKCCPAAKICSGKDKTPTG